LYILQIFIYPEAAVVVVGVGVVVRPLQATVSVPGIDFRK